MFSVGMILGAILMLLRPRLNYYWFRLLLRIPDGPRFPVWYSRGLEWLALHTTPPEGY